MSRSDSRRDDLVSAAHEALVRSSRRFEPSRASFSTYAGRRVFGSMLNVLAANSKWHQAHRAAFTSDGDFAQQTSVPPDAERSTLTSQILAALDKLPPSSRDLITGHYLEEQTLTEIGSRHGLSKTRASVRLSQSIDQIRKLLDDGCVVWPPKTKKSKRRFTGQQRSEVITCARSGAVSLSKLARDFGIPRTTIITWLRSSTTQLAS